MGGTINGLAIIVAIIAALVGFGIGFAFYADEDKGLAAVFGFFGAVLGAIAGFLLTWVVIVIALIGLMIYAASLSM